MLETKKIQLLDWVMPIFDRSNRFCVFAGGRGGAKSMQVAKAYIKKAMQERCLILCCRQFQKSIKDSVYSILKEIIEEYSLQCYFKLTINEIYCTLTGSVFKFYGLHHHPESIKGLQGLTDCWIEEASTINSVSWEILRPTVRKNNSQIVCTLNPRYATDCIYDMFFVNAPPPNSYVVKVNYDSNPFFTDVLEAERLYLLNKDIGLYKHVWQGCLLENSDAQIFNNHWVVEDFVVDRSQIFYIGLDFGYSVDPTAAIACYIKENTLYIAYEAGRTKLDIDNIGEYCEKRIPMFKTEPIYADSANPAQIAYLVKTGYRVYPALKKPGSIEDGIAYIRSFDRVVIHPSCTETAKEFMLYSYKIDPRSDEVTNKIVDAYNHYIDAIRYALSKLTYNRANNWEVYKKYA